MRMELAPSMHGAILRVTFPPNTKNTEKRICFKLEGDSWEKLEKQADGTAVIVGSSGRVNGHPSGFRHYIRALSDEAVDKVEHAGRDCGCFTYARDAASATVRVATSFIDQAQAATNYDREVQSCQRPIDQGESSTRGCITLSGGTRVAHALVTRLSRSFLFFSPPPPLLPPPPSLPRASRRICA
jgi:hypothetical protein